MSTELLETYRGFK